MFPYFEHAWTNIPVPHSCENNWAGLPFVCLVAFFFFSQQVKPGQLSLKSETLYSHTNNPRLPLFKNIKGHGLATGRPNAQISLSTGSGKRAFIKSLSHLVWHVRGEASLNIRLVACNASALWADEQLLYFFIF